MFCWKLKKANASPAEIAEKAKEMANFKEMYKKPWLIVLITYAEILLIGLIISLISPMSMKRKSKYPEIVEIPLN